jgi:hypothetical protein
MLEIKTLSEARRELKEVQARLDEVLATIEQITSPASRREALMRAVKEREWDEG